jgi:16S rRNA (cytosine1402-N4)-methyltransferase
MTDFQHLTVLCDEAVDAVLTQTSGCYIDATFGRGGHTRKLLAALSPTARVIAFDKDPKAIET